MKGTIAIDFDGVIHKYSKGWQGTSIYDEPVGGVFQAIRKLMDRGYSCYVFSARDSKQIVEWIQSFTGELHDEPIPYIFKVQRVPFWHKKWDRKGTLGVTDRKLPAIAYIDDRAVLFTNWDDILNKYE